jgi:hypothetical protein
MSTTKESLINKIDFHLKYIKILIIHFLYVTQNISQKI